MQLLMMRYRWTWVMTLENWSKRPLRSPNAARTFAGNPDASSDWADVAVVASPAWYDDYVLTVASVGPGGLASPFTLAGPWVDVAAPGAQVGAQHEEPVHVLGQGREELAALPIRECRQRGMGGAGDEVKVAVADLLPRGLRLVSHLDG